MPMSICGTEWRDTVRPVSDRGEPVGCPTRVSTLGWVFVMALVAASEVRFLMLVSANRVTSTGMCTVTQADIVCRSGGVAAAFGLTERSDNILH